MLNHGDSTTEVCDGIVLKGLSYDELVSVGDINVGIGYWLGNVNDVGDDIEVAWSRVE